MGFFRSSSAVPFGIGLLVAVWLQQGNAGESPVEVGEVVVPALDGQAAANADIDSASLRTMVSQAVRTLDGSKLPRGSRAVLSVSLVRMNARVDHAAAVTCGVSATLRDRAGGSIFAVIEGNASGEDEPRRLRALERATVRAAVGSAVARVPEAMQTRRR
jgi:hypothetical protein